MTDILSRLSEAAWRGIEFPIAHREFGFSQDQEAHRFIFRDEQLIESLGLTNPTYRFVIPFREDIARGPWKNLFTDVYPQFLSACLDRTKGILLDPFHGPVQCKVTSLQETADPNRRDGVDVEANFVIANDEAASQTERDLGAQFATIEGAEGLQHALDTNLSSSDLDDETKKKLAELNKDASPARLNPLQFATGAVNQVEVAGNKIAAQFGQVANQAEALDNGVRRVARPDLQPIRSNARRLQLAALDLAKTPVGGNSQRGKVIRTFNVPSDTGTLSLAGKLGMSVQDLIKLNPLIGRSPTVATGTAVLYFS